MKKDGKFEGFGGFGRGREGKADREGKRDTWSSLGRNGVNCVGIAFAAARVLRRREWREMGWKWTRKKVSVFTEKIPLGNYARLITSGLGLWPVCTYLNRVHRSGSDYLLELKSGWNSDYFWVQPQRIGDPFTFVSINRFKYNGPPWIHTIEVFYTLESNNWEILGTSPN